MGLSSFFSSLIQNVTILVSIVLLYDYLWAKKGSIQSFFGQLIAGVMVGGVVIVLMSTPWVLAEGLVFDTRTVLLSVCGFMLGYAPTLIGMFLAALYRIHMGGPGVWMGLLTILSSGALGLIWYRYASHWRVKSIFVHLVTLGVAVHLVMLLCVLVLPGELRIKTFETVLLPALTVYPMVTVLLGMLLNERSQNWKDRLRRIELEQLYLSLVEQMPAGVFRKNADGVYVFVNRLFCELKGLTKEEIVGKSPQTLYEYEIQKERDGGYPTPPVQRTYADKGEEHHEWIMKHGKSITVLESYPQSNGQIRHFRVVKTPILDASGKVIGSQGMQFDISSTKQVEEALRQEQYLLSSFMDNTNDCIFFKDTHGRFIRINKRQLRLLGAAHEKTVLGKTDFDFFSTVHAQKAFDDEMGILRSGEPIYNLEERLTWADGRELWVMTSKFPFRNKEGEVIGTFGVSKDITPQKRLENDLLSALNRVEESDRLKTAFLHNISHEIRTPMNAIVGFSGLLKDPNIGNERKDHMADVIVQSSNQLLSIIDDIVRIATIEAGQEKLNESPVQLNALMRYAHEQFMDRATTQRLDFPLSIGLPGDGVYVLMDETKMLQTLSNLLVNAFKFTKTGYVHLGYSLHEDTLCFFVEDSGIGIAPEMHDEVFKRFSQVDNLMTRRYGGSGLGLSICKAYTELMGGTLTLESEPNRGTRFTVCIPYKPVNPTEPIVRDLEGVGEVLTGGRGRTILVAEDEEMNFILLKELLRPFEFHILRAENGLEAFRLVNAEEAIELVLMDLKMPVMDGFEATRLILDVKPELPVLALTAYSQDADMKKAKESGCREVMIKSLERKVLYDHVSAYLKLRNPLL
jgi:PAS domain S-box-containing protein